MWQPLASMPFAVEKHIAVELKDEIYIAGGKRFQCYNHTRDAWSVKSNISGGSAQSLAKSNDILYAITTNWTIYQYDTNRDTWATVIQSEKCQHSNVEIVPTNFRLVFSRVLAESLQRSIIPTKFSYCARMGSIMFLKSVQRQTSSV